MKNIIRTWLIKVFLVFLFVLPTNAELLLFKRGNDEIYHAVDSQTYQKESVENQREIRSIFTEILMVFQWPMITTHFHLLPQQTQERYLDALKKEHGITLFIQEMLNQKFKDKYKVQFVPTTIFDLAAINSFMQYVINYEPHSISQNEKVNSNQNINSIFPVDDIRNGDFGANQFRDAFASDILEGLRKFQDKPNAELYAMRIACDKYNLSEAVFKLFLQTTSFIASNNTGNLKNEGSEHSFCKVVQNEDGLKDLIAKFTEFYDEHKNAFYANTQSKEKGFYYRLYAQQNQFQSTKADYMSKNYEKYLIEGAKLECQAEKENNFLLFRGTKGFKIHEQSVDEKSSSTIIDSPYQESAEDYAKALKDLPDSLKKYLPVSISNKPADQRNEFHPFSLSYANSLLDGTFYEAELGKGARALDYFSTGYGYVLIFPIANFFQEIPKPSLRQKYFIPALHPLVALFGKGEFFHARSKLSLFDSKKKLRGYGGLNLPTATEKEIPELDRATQGSFFVTSGVDWVTLRTSISHDIADHSIWIKEPPNPEDWIDTQKNFALFSSMEISAFKDHFLKYQPVLNQIKNPNLKQLSPIGVDKTLGGTIERMLIPESMPKKQAYDDSNVFEKIIQNPAHMNTAPIINTSQSLSFDDHKKRVKEHILVIPKGKYSSFSHFIDFASPAEIRDLMKTIAETAKIRGLDKTGYRIITNNSLNPGKKNNNDAEQEIPHFHIHLAGGECLGKPVVGSREGRARSDLDMTISPHPFAFDWTPGQLYQYAMAHKIGERFIKGKERKVIAYFQEEDTDVGVKMLIGFILLDNKSRSAYTSVHDFALNATPEEIAGLFKFINDVARKVGIDQTGFRLISGFSNDAGQYPKNVMSISIAGGNMLGATVANVYGNRKIWEGGSVVLGYIDLQAPYPHEHCASNAYDTYELIDKYKNRVPEEFVKENPVLDLTFSSWKKISVNEKISKIKRPQDIRKIIFNGHKDDSIIESIKIFKNVEELELRGNRLKTIPDIVLSFKKLRMLDVGDNLIESIPADIDQLETLESLNLTSNRLQTVNENICKNINLKNVFLGDNPALQILPECFGNLRSLERLLIHKTGIKVLPHSFLNLKDILRELILSKDFEYSGENGSIGKKELRQEFTKVAVNYQ